MRAPTEIAPHRLGCPSPLPAYLSASAASLSLAIQSVSSPHRAGPLQDLPDAPGPLAVAEAGMQSVQAMLRGIRKWQTHPYRSPAPDAPVLWQESVSTLRDFGGTGIPILVVPSLINRPDILHIHPRRAFLENLRAQGFRPLLFDWGRPGQVEAPLSLDDLILQRLRPALAIARVLNGKPVPVLGYCMGGTIATALSQIAQQDVSALITIAAPWDFAQAIQPVKTLRAHLLQDGGAGARLGLEQICQHFGGLPGLASQYAFFHLDPFNVQARFARFDAMEADDEAAEIFVAVEDWLNDGVSLAPKVAHTILLDWQIFNKPFLGQWRLSGQRINPAELQRPSLHITPQKDHIVTPACAFALVQAMKHAQSHRPDCGHVGAIVSAQQSVEIPKTIGNWLKALAPV